MAVEIKSGSGSDLATIDPTSKAVRVTPYDSSGVPIDLNVPVAVVCNHVTVVNNDVVDSLDVSSFAFVSLQLTGTWVATVKFEGSNNNGTFDPIVSQNMSEPLEPYTSTTQSVGMFKIPTSFKYLRVRVTSYTSGIVDCEGFAYKIDSNTGQISATGTVNISAGQSLAVTTVSGQSVTYGAGNADAGTQRVTLATDPTPSISEKIISAVGVNATLLKASPANINMLLMVSTAATPRFVKFYDQTTVPVVGTDIPRYTFPLAVGASPLNLPAKGLDFANGLAYAILLNVADSGTTPFTVAGEVVMMMDYT